MSQKYYGLEDPESWEAEFKRAQAEYAKNKAAWDAIFFGTGIIKQTGDVIEHINPYEFFDKKE